MQFVRQTQQKSAPTPTQQAPTQHQFNPPPPPHQTHHIQPGMGSVQSLRPAPPPCPQLHPSASGGLDVHVRMRLGVLFSSGVFGVLEVDAGGRLRMGVAPPQVRVIAADGASFCFGACTAGQVRQAVIWPSISRSLNSTMQAHTHIRTLKPKTRPTTKGLCRPCGLSSGYRLGAAAVAYRGRLGAGGGPERRLSGPARHLPGVVAFGVLLWCAAVVGCC